MIFSPPTGSELRDAYTRGTIPCGREASYFDRDPSIPFFLAERAIMDARLGASRLTVQQVGIATRDQLSAARTLLRDWDTPWQWRYTGAADDQLAAELERRTLEVDA